MKGKKICLLEIRYCPKILYLSFSLVKRVIHNCFNINRWFSFGEMYRQIWILRVAGMRHSAPGQWELPPHETFEILCFQWLKSENSLRKSIMFPNTPRSTKIPNRENNIWTQCYGQKASGIMFLFHVVVLINLNKDIQALSGIILQNISTVYYIFFFFLINQWG